ncbi:hypothetical protein [Streptomyces chartreusis]
MKKTSAIADQPAFVDALVLVAATAPQVWSAPTDGRGDFGTETRRAVWTAAGALPSAKPGKPPSANGWQRTRECLLERAW